MSNLNDEDKVKKEESKIPKKEEKEEKKEPTEIGRASCRERV